MARRHDPPAPPSPPARSPTHHPDDAMLVDYAAGHLDEATGLLIATHLALCPPCRRATATFDALGGALLDALPPASVGEDSLSAVLARLDEPGDPVRGVTAPADGVAAAPPSLPALPEPLRSYVGCELGAVRWKPLLPGVDHYPIPLAPGPSATRLLRLSGGRGIPRHRHRGLEITLVLLGGFSDHRGHYRRGDLAVADAAVDHRPIADHGEDCLCVAITDSPLELTGPLGRWINPLLRSP